MNLDQTESIGYPEWRTGQNAVFEMEIRHVTQIPLRSYELGVELSSYMLRFRMNIEYIHYTKVRKKTSPAKSVRTSLAASTLAGLSKFGESDERREMTLMSWNGRVQK